MRLLAVNVEVCKAMHVLHGMHACSAAALLMGQAAVNASGAHACAPADTHSTDDAQLLTPCTPCLQTYSYVSYDQAATAAAASFWVPVSAPTATHSTAGYANHKGTGACSNLTTDRVSLRLRRADALGARLRQLLSRGCRGRQHRLNLVQARPVLAGHKDALACRVVRDAYAVWEGLNQTEVRKGG